MLYTCSAARSPARTLPPSPLSVWRLAVVRSDSCRSSSERALINDSCACLYSRAKVLIPPLGSHELLVWESRAVRAKLGEVAAPVQVRPDRSLVPRRCIGGSSAKHVFTSQRINRSSIELYWSRRSSCWRTRISLYSCCIRVRYERGVSGRDSGDSGSYSRGFLGARRRRSTGGGSVTTGTGRGGGGLRGFRSRGLGAGGGTASSGAAGSTGGATGAGATCSGSTGSTDSAGSITTSLAT